MSKIQEIRKEKNLRQEDLALALGVERSTVAKWETGIASPRAELFPKLAKVLGCTIDELFDINSEHREENQNVERKDC